MRHSGSRLQLIFLKISLTVVTDFNVSKNNVIYFINVNMIINEKSEIKNELKLKLCTSRVRFLGC